MQKLSPQQKNCSRALFFKASNRWNRYLFNLSMHSVDIKSSIKNSRKVLLFLSLAWSQQQLVKFKITRKIMHCIEACARYNCIRNFFLGNVYLTAKKYFVADVIISMAGFMFSLCIANLLSFPDLIWQSGVVYIGKSIVYHSHWSYEKKLYGES